MGLSQSRISGWEHATADVVAILDAHIEVTEGWYARLLLNGKGFHGRRLLVYFNILTRAEPLLARIKADRTVVVSPVFDKINFDDLGVEKYLPAAQGFDWPLWCMYESFSAEWLRGDDNSRPGK